MAKTSQGYRRKIDAAHRDMFIKSVMLVKSHIDKRGRLSLVPTRPCSTIGEMPMGIVGRAMGPTHSGH